jgi:hypothetical protein
VTSSLSPSPALPARLLQTWIGGRGYRARQLSFDVKLVALLDDLAHGRIRDALRARAGLGGVRARHQLRPFPSRIATQNSHEHGSLFGSFVVQKHACGDAWP